MAPRLPKNCFKNKRKIPGNTPPSVNKSVKSSGILFPKISTGRKAPRKIYKKQIKGIFLIIIGLFRFAMVKATRKNKTKGKRTLKDPNKNTSPCESPSPTIPQNPKLLSSKSKETRKDKIKMASSLSPVYAFCSTFPCIAFFLLVPLPVLFLFVLFLAIKPHNSYFFPVHYITFSRQKKAKALLAI